MEAERRVLANGLRIALIHDPDASQAAALFHLDAGSLHEPYAWPGLAHLLEHVLFAGSEGFPGEARLMAWAPAEGALLNATTQANATAWFVGMAADKLPEALARLADMLARPLLAIDAVRQEANVIEAEYRLLAQHAGAQCEAALSHAFAAPHPFQRFQIGSRECFGEDAIALQQALKAYHQRFFHAGNLTLWLQGPQPVEELAALAAHVGSVFRLAVHPATPPPALKAGAQRAFAMQSSRLRLLQIGFLVSACHADSFALLEALLYDPAPDTLLNRLRREGLCDEVKLLEPYRSPSQSLLLFEFQLCETASAGRIEALLRRWLAQLDALSDTTLSHYAALARQRFRRRSPLDQLRARAFGFPPASTQGFAGLRAQLRPADAVSLHVAPEIVAEKVWLRGFHLRFTPTHREDVALFPAPVMKFYGGGNLPVLSALPADRAALTHVPAADATLLLLSPHPDLLLPATRAAQIAAALEAPGGECQHAGGEVSFTREQGVWLLKLSGSGERLPLMLYRVVQTLRSMDAADIARGQRLARRMQEAASEDIAVRALLARLPDLLQRSRDNVRWRAALYGGDDALADTLSRLLSHFPAPFAPADAPTRPAAVKAVWPVAGSDTAVLVYCPLADHTPQNYVAYPVMAALFGPRFFQQLRVERNIGYVVSCRFHQVAGTAGLLFTLQSPTLSAAELFDLITHFISEAGAIIDAQTADSLRALALRCLNPAAAPRHEAGILEHWQTRYPLTADRIDALTPETLQASYRQLSASPRWQLASRP